MRRLAAPWLLCMALVAPAQAQGPEPAPRARLYAFFATWCIPCRFELPALERLHRTYRARGLRTILVSEDAPSTAGNLPGFLAGLGVTLPFRVDNESALLERYHPAATVPFVVLLDQAGRVLYAHAGYEPGEEQDLELAIARQLLPPHGSARPAAQAKGELSALLQSLGLWRKDRFDPVERRTLRAGAARLEVTGRSGGMAAHARVDGALVAEEGATRRDDVRLERAYAELDLGALRLRAGDGYVAFGRGVGLSLRKVDPLGVDTGYAPDHARAELLTYKGLTVTFPAVPKDLLRSGEVGGRWLQGHRTARRVARHHLGRSLAAETIPGATAR